MSKACLAETVVTATDQQVSAVFDGEAVVLQLEQGMYYGMNDVGSLVWDKLQKQPCSLSELCAAVAELYEVDEATCRQDVAAFLETLLHKGLVRIGHARTS